MGTSAKGSVGIAIEPLAAQGQQVLLPYTTVGVTLSLTTQPSGSQGMKLTVNVSGNITPGTFTISGTDTSGNAITEGPITVPVPLQPNQPQTTQKFEYTTTHNFAAVSASGIATTGMASAQIQVLGNYAAKYKWPGIITGKTSYTKYKPKEFRGLPFATTSNIQLEKNVSLDSFDQDLYPTGSMWWVLGLCNDLSNWTVTTNPVTPSVLLASAAVSGSPLSLTTQPANPQILKFIVTGTSVSGVITVAGTDEFGISLTETVSASGNGTFYTTRRFKTVNASGIVVTGLTSGSVAISGITNFIWKGFPSITQSTLGVEYFTGTDSNILSYVALSEGTITSSAKGKSVSLTSKGICQDIQAIGDRTTTNMVADRTTNPNLSLTPAIPVSGQSVTVYIDPLGSTPGTNQVTNVMDTKVTFTNPIEPVFTSTNSQTLQSIERGQVSAMMDLTVIMKDMTQREACRQNGLQYFTINYGGGAAGSGFLNWQLTFAGRVDSYDETWSPDGKFVTAAMQIAGEYDNTLGSMYSWQISNLINPNYAN